MRERELFHLTVKDHGILEALQGRIAGETAITALLERKLANCTLWRTEDVPPGVVTLNSRVRFRPAGGMPQTRIISLNAMGGNIDAVLPISDRRGLALIGLSEGDAISYEGAEGAPETLELLAVLHQPEAARRALREHEGERGVLRLVHSAPGHAPARMSAKKPASPPARAPGWWDGDDDPGPSAA